MSLLAGSQVPWAALIQRQLLGNGSEELPHILARLCGGLEKKQARLAGILLRVGSRNCTLVGRFSDQIELVPGEGDYDVLVCLSLEFLHPCFGLV